MKRTFKALPLILLLTVFLTASPLGTATWTGRFKKGYSVSNRPVIQCEYKYFNNTFWKLFEGSNCPSQIEVY